MLLFVRFPHSNMRLRQVSVKAAFNLGDALARSNHTVALAIPAILSTARPECSLDGSKAEASSINPWLLQIALFHAPRFACMAADNPPASHKSHQLWNRRRDRCRY